MWEGSREVKLRIGELGHLECGGGKSKFVQVGKTSNFLDHKESRKQLAFKIAGVVVALDSHTQGKQKRKRIWVQGQGAGKVPISCTIWFLFHVASSVLLGAFDSFFTTAAVRVPFLLLDLERSGPLFCYWLKNQT